MVVLDIVGCGEVALQFHGPVLRHLRRQGVVRVGGCYDPDQGRARRLCRWLRGERWGEDVPEAIAPSVHAALIATPPESHADVALRYISAGRHVLIEKPFVGTRAEADRVVAAAGETGARVLVGHMRRFFPSVRIARDLVLSGGLGTIEQVVATEGARWGGWNVASNYVVEDPLGGVLYDTGAHVLDTLLFVLGADEDPCVQLRVSRVARDRPEPSQDIGADLVITSERLGAVPVRVAVSRTRALAAGLRFTSERGTLVLPAAFAAAPRLVTAGRAFTLDHAFSDVEATDPLGAFKQEHLALIDAARGSPTTTVLDAARFLTLTSLLHLLATAGAAP